MAINSSKSLQEGVSYNSVLTTDVIREGEPWPPMSQRDRILRYDKNKLLFGGKHQDVYVTWASTISHETDIQRDLEYIIANFPGALSRLMADLLFGEFSPTLGATCKNLTTQGEVERIIGDNNLLLKAYETSGVGASYRGDGVYKVYIPRGSDKVVISSINPRIWFPIVDPGDTKEIISHIIAYPVTINGNTYLRKEIYNKGEVYRQAFELKGLTIGRAQPISKVFGNDVKEHEQLKIKEFLIFHNPNYTTDDELFGLDDYIELDSIFPAVNKFMTRVDYVLSKHTDPGMYGPASALEEDERTGELQFKVGGRYIPMEAGEANPGYLVWDAKLDAARNHLEKLLEIMFYISETSPAAFGLDKSAISEAGVALRTRLMRPLAKVNRKRLYIDPCLKHIIDIAQQLEIEYLGKNYEKEIPEFEWQDGLPDNPSETANVMAVRGSGKTVTKATAIQKLDKVSADEAKRRAEEIKKEELEEIESKSTPWNRVPSVQSIMNQMAQQTTKPNTPAPEPEGGDDK